MNLSVVYVYVGVCRHALIGVCMGGHEGLHVIPNTEIKKAHHLEL
jgi:hypothetical protein